jgi:hypothetical protein
LNQAGIGEHIYCVLCGRMTPDQKQIVHMRAIVDTQLFIDILHWSVKESGHQGYKKTTMPEECPQPLFVEDQETNNSTDKSVKVDVETNIEVGHIISPPRKNHQRTHLCTVCLMNLLLQCFSVQHPHCWHMVALTPTLRRQTSKIYYHFAFPFGIGGLKMTRKAKVSYELCIQLYMKLSLQQFMAGAIILVMNHIYSRQMSYKSGVMICRSTVDGTPLGEKLSIMSMTDFEKSMIKN